MELLLLLCVYKSSVSDIEIYYVYKSWMGLSVFVVNVIIVVVVAVVVVVMVVVVVIIVLLRCVRASHFVRQFGRRESRDRLTAQI